MKERLEEFKSKLADLIDEYKVEISASDEYMGYPECGEDIQIVMFIMGEVIEGKYHDCVEEKFGSMLDSESLRNHVQTP